MNQILCTNLGKQDVETSKKKNWFKFQFSISMIIITILIFSGIFYFYRLQEKEKISNDLISNYNIYRLYNHSNNTDNDALQNNLNALFGIIEIPKINLYYPVFSNCSEELLRIAPCKFYGETPDVNGNICIAGHNYDNSLFFSKLSTLSVNDFISIFDINDNKYIYRVFDVYEVEPSNLSPIFNYEADMKILTLVTCNNLNSNRIIVKAKIE